MYDYVLQMILLVYNICRYCGTNEIDYNAFGITTYAYPNDKEGVRVPMNNECSLLIKEEDDTRWGLHLYSKSEKRCEWYFKKEYPEFTNDELKEIVNKIVEELNK